MALVPESGKTLVERINDVMRSFYEKAYQGEEYSPFEKAEDHGHFQSLEEFIYSFELGSKECLEVGAGRGPFQTFSEKYFGVDLAKNAGVYFNRPFCVATADKLPFPDKSFKGIWSITVSEHVPNLEQSFLELWRVLDGGGYLYLAPAWNCRSWFSEGYPVRPYSDFKLKGKLIKASIPIRDSLLFRSMIAFPKRLVRLISYLLNRRPTRLRFRKLKPNYEIFWLSDSDAVNSIDPFEAYLWFVSREAECINYPSIFRAYFVRNGPLILKKSHPVP